MKLSPELFELYAAFIKTRYGIRLGVEKREQLDYKLQRLMVKHDVSGLEDYYKLLVRGSTEHVKSLMEELTVHKTEFFREKHHFDFLNQHGQLASWTEQTKQAGEFKAWSAGCSTGEEPYTLAMTLRDALPQHIRLRVLATDVSRKVLVTAQRGVYPDSVERDISPGFIRRYFHRSGSELVVDQSLKQLITFREFNLMSPFPFRGKFDVIFCRNVMIYFDSATQEALVEKFHEALAPGGYLCIGHSESLSNLKTKFVFIKPTIYMRGRRRGDV